MNASALPTLPSWAVEPFQREDGTWDAWVRGEIVTLAYESEERVENWIDGFLQGEDINV